MERKFSLWQLIAAMCAAGFACFISGAMLMALVGPAPLALVPTSPLSTATATKTALPTDTLTPPPTQAAATFTARPANTSIPPTNTLNPSPTVTLTLTGTPTPHQGCPSGIQPIAEDAGYEIFNGTMGIGDWGISVEEVFANGDCTKTPTVLITWGSFSNSRTSGSTNRTNLTEVKVSLFVAKGSKSPFPQWNGIISDACVIATEMLEAGSADVVDLRGKKIISFSVAECVATQTNQ